MGVQGRTFSPLVQPAAAPLLTQAQMDPSLATISVGFDKATNEVLCSASDIAGQECIVYIGTQEKATWSSGLSGLEEPKSRLHVLGDRVWETAPGMAVAGEHGDGHGLHEGA